MQRKINQPQRLVTFRRQSMVPERRSVPGHHHAARTQPHIDRLAQQRRQQIRNPGLPHPVRQILAIASSDQQRVRLLEHGDPHLPLNARQRSKLQHSQRPPTHLAKRIAQRSADHPIRYVSPIGQRVNRGGNKKRARLGHRLAQQLNQRVVNARVADTCRSKKKPHEVIMPERLTASPTPSSNQSARSQTAAATAQTTPDSPSPDTHTLHPTRRPTSTPSASAAPAF